MALPASREDPSLDTVREGLDYLKTKMPSLDVDRVLSQYDALKRTHLRT